MSESWLPPLPPRPRASDKQQHEPLQRKPLPASPRLTVEASKFMPPGNFYASPENHAVSDSVLPSVPPFPVGSKGSNGSMENVLITEPATTPHLPVRPKKSKESVLISEPLPSPKLSKEGKKALPKYTYGSVNSADAEIRLLELDFDVKQVLGRINTKPITGSMIKCRLPVPTLSRPQRLLRVAQLPVYEALSYVWGEPERTRSIIVDSQRLDITQNLYDALKDILREGDVVRIWADAICINQDDLPERSAQILLMRQIYFSATYVNIWLGQPTEDGRKCLQFIQHFTSKYSENTYQYDTEDNKIEENTTLGIYLPARAVVHGGYAFANAMEQVSDILGHSVTLDDDKDVVSDRSGSLSLHDETIESLVSWKPANRYWKTVKNENFPEMASLIDRTFLQSCDWFGRMWVVQEMGVAVSCQILYDGRTVLMENFLRCICYLHYNLHAPLTHIRKLIGLEKIRLGWNEGKRQSLKDLILECRHRRASDPRDKIFSLLGIMGDKMNEFLKPDYTKSVSQVFAEVTFHFIIKASSLDPLCGWQSLGRQEILGSWVPDYTLTQDLAPTPLITQDGCEYNASGHDYRSVYDTSYLNTGGSWGQLPTTGLRIDMITSLSDPAPEDESFGYIESLWHSTITHAGPHLPALTEEVVLYLDHISSIVSKCNQFWQSADRTSQYSHSTDNLSKDLKTWWSSKITPKASRTSSMQSEISIASSSSTPEVNPLLHHTYILDAYLQTLLCGRISTHQRLTKAKIDSIVNLSLLNDPSSHDRKPGGLYELCEAFQSGMSKRRIGITHKGYIGAIPQDTQPGDFICVLFGCSVPVVLRKRIGEEYFFVGECYLHGFMDAEAIVMQVKGQLKEEKFVLC